MELTQFSREREIGEIRLQHSISQYQDCLTRMQQIIQELELAREAPILSAMVSKKETLQILQAKLHNAEKNYQQSLASANRFRHELKETERTLYATQDELQNLNTQQASLLAAQAVNLKRISSPSSPAQTDTLAFVEKIQVEKEWQYACEIVLAECLQARVLNSSKDLITAIKTLSASPTLLLTTRPKLTQKNRYPTLAEKITGPLPNWFLSLDNIYAAAHVSEAMDWLPNLTKDESVITIDGFWLSKSWAKIVKQDSQKEEVGLLERQAKLTECDKLIPKIQKKRIQLTTQRTQIYDRLNKIEHYLVDTEQNLLNLREEIRKHESDFDTKSYELKQFHSKHATLLLEQEKLELTMQDLINQQKEAQLLIEINSQKFQSRESQQLKIITIKLDDDKKMAIQAEAIEEARKALYATQLQIECEKLRLQQVETTLQQEETQYETFQIRFAQLEAQFQQVLYPELSLSLTEKEREKRLIEEELKEKRRLAAVLNEQLANSESKLKAAESQIKNTKDAIYHHRLQEHAFVVRAHTIEEALKELDCNVDVIITSIHTGITQAMREKSLQRVEQKIKELGPINLIAIEEHQTELTRKQVLDTQHEDLIEALVLLKKAIETMDAETSSQLEKTFVSLNSTFQTIFPRLFGGGTARLMLTEIIFSIPELLLWLNPPGSVIIRYSCFQAVRRQ